MKRSLTKVSAALALAVTTAAWFGCSSSSNGFSGGSNFTPGIVNLAVGDGDNTASGPAGNKVLIYLDVLHNITAGSNPTPDVILDNATSGINWPRSVIFGGNDLYVGSNTAYSGTANDVRIFRDYRTLPNNAVPDAVLSTTATIGYVDQIVYSELDDTLVVADRSTGSDGQVILFRNASAISADVAPDVVLNTDTEINRPHGLAIREDATTSGQADLYVANSNPAATGSCVSIYRDIATLASGDAPDARLNEDTSFFGFDTECYKVDVINNILYVSALFNETGIFIFNGADSLTDDAIPDVILSNPTSGVLDPLNVTVVNNTLWVADGSEEDDCGAHASLLGYANAETTDANGNTVSGLTSGQVPVATFPNISKAHYARSAAGSLFVDPIDGCDEQLGDVNIWVNAATASLGLPPDYNIVGGGGGTLATDLIRAISIDVVVDSGT